MKRYVMSIVLAVLIIVSLSTFYVQAAKDNKPKFQLVMLAGDEKEADKVRLYGQVTYNSSQKLNLYSRNITISSTGSDYESDRTLFQKLDVETEYYNMRSGIDRLYREHRQFMRGKSRGLFYEDGQVLIYTTLKNNDIGEGERKLQVSLLEKETDKTREFEITLPTLNMTSGIGMEDLQLIGDEINVAVSSLEKVAVLNKDGQGAERGYHVYRIDMNSGKITGDNLLKANDKYAVRQSDIIHKHEHFVLSESSETAKHLYAYNYAANTLEQLPLELPPVTRNVTVVDGEELPSVRNTSCVDRDILFLMQQSPKSIEVKRYDLQAQTTLEPLKFTSEQLAVDRIAGVTVQDNRLYIELKKDHAPAIAIVDASSGAVLYKGKVELQGTKSEQEKPINQKLLKQLQIQNIYLRSE